MNQEQVRPQWSEIVILFDNGEYSVIAGRNEGGLGLGERWNRHEDDPVWHVVPEFLAIPMLHGLLDELARTPQGEERIVAILWELHRRLNRDREK